MPRRVANNERVMIALVQAGIWEIDNCGRIWRIAVLRWCKSTSSNKVVGIERKPMEVGNGPYRQVQAHIGSKVMRCLAHRLVWQHMFGDIPHELFINHIDGNKLNNAPSNLELVTTSENTRHAYAMGLTKILRGEEKPNSRLTDAQATAIRHRRSAGERGRVLAKEYGVSEQVISLLVRGKTYSHILGEQNVATH